MGTTKLRLKIGPHEFEAEGPEEVVNGYLDLWRAAIETPAARGAVSSTASIAATTQKSNDTPLPEGDKAQDPSPVVSEDGISNDQVSRLVESDDKRGGMRLRAVPPERADAVLLLLYGALRMRGEDEVPATKLVSALERSGVGVGRVDRDAASYLRQRLITRSGKGKGGQYRLTTTGMAKAAEVAKTLLGQFPSA